MELSSWNTHGPSIHWRIGESFLPDSPGSDGEGSPRRVDRSLRTPRQQCSPGWQTDFGLDGRRLAMNHILTPLGSETGGVILYMDVFIDESQDNERLALSGIVVPDVIVPQSIVGKWRTIARRL